MGGNRTIELVVLADVLSVARHATGVVAHRAREAVTARGRFSLALSGGRTPWEMCARLADVPVPWEQTAIYQVDERIAPAGDPDRNLTQLRASLPAGAASRLHPMPVEDPDLEAAALQYAASLPDRFDLVHLGLGPDGHTASLVPGDPVLDVFDRDVALTGDYQGRRRMTLTYPVLDRAWLVVWLVTGEDKRDALGLLLEGDRSIPAGRVAASRALVVADQAAASRL
jgi:6-phosphogluconolactonase